jgi:hypothetical protein
MRNGTKFLKETFGEKKTIGVEIGVHDGSHAIELYENLNIKQLYLVDIWENFNQEGQNSNYNFSYEITKNKFKDKKNVIIIKGDSVEIAKTFKSNSLDFVYIDANHQYEYVKKDIEAWYPKIKDNGYIAGHDYGGYWKGVKKAVDEFIINSCPNALFNSYYPIEKLLKNTQGFGDWWVKK